MIIHQKRIANVYKPIEGRAYCISHIYVNGKYVCDAIEDYDRGLDRQMPLETILRNKVYGQTAIPTGTYNLLVRTPSPKFGSMAFYKYTCQGCVPRLACVLGFDGILVHCGVDERSTLGCIIVGKNEVVGAVTHTKPSFIALYNYIALAKRNNEPITWTITRTYKVSLAV